MEAKLPGWSNVSNSRGCWIRDTAAKKKKKVLSLLNMGESSEFKETRQERERITKEPKDYIAVWKLWRSTLSTIFQVSIMSEELILKVVILLTVWLWAAQLIF